MARLGSTIARLAKMRAMPGMAMPAPPGDRLTDIADFGSNPGALQARCYIPDDLPAGAPLVVVLHGCTQNAAGYDHGAGWSQLADELKFAVLLPEQQRSNNPNLCFNWFSAADARRDCGEALSIRQMVDAITAAHDLDRSRVFVTGLSAGGAMTSIMLAAYPDVFAGGAIIAGLPFGCANSVGDAFSRMSGQGYPSDERLGALVRDASTYDGPWPTISVWHGSADMTVDASNADRILGQWRSIHGLLDAEPEQDSVAGCAHRTWRDDMGRAVIEAYAISGMGHGTPIRTVGPEACGAAAPYLIEGPISSTREIARFWGLSDGAARVAEPTAAISAPTARARPAPISPPAFGSARPASGVGAIIEDALRAAGLMR
jgi:poly(hydroxyalkanoate) depolymerase family esterase